MANENFLRKVIVDILPPTGQGVSITDLKINFKCVKTNESTPNSAKVEVYNLSPTTRNLLTIRNVVVRLTVGYMGMDGFGQPNKAIGGNPGIGTVFIGNVVKVKSEKKKKNKGDDYPLQTRLENTDLITSIDIGDGDNQYRNAYLDKGYPPNTSLETVVGDLTNAMGLNIGAQLEVPRVTYNQGYALTGLCRDNFDQICEDNDLEWSIQDQAVQVISKTGTAKVQTIVVNARTGMLGVPAQTGYGVKFRTLCDHRLIPGRAVQVTSIMMNNGKTQIYKIRKVTHHGDNWGGDYFSDVEATLPQVYS